MKYSSQPSFPVNVLAKNGKRERDHSGPCSVMLGELTKYRASSSSGLGGERSAAQNADVAERSVALRVGDMANGSLHATHHDGFIG